MQTKEDCPKFGQVPGTCGLLGNWELVPQAGTYSIFVLFTWAGPEAIKFFPLRKLDLSEEQCSFTSVTTGD